ncbi:MAG: integrase arm-type DNA-binding domain-containing protein [Pseudolabrys sp.]|jgi:integrase
MARFALTDRFVQNAKSREGQSEYFDDTTRGLALRVSKGAKAWCFHYTTSGTRKRLTLGTYPATTLSKARTLATEARGLLEAGEDPRTITAAAESLKAICEEYLSREGSKLRTAQERQKTFNRLVYPTLGTVKIDAIRRTDIVRLLDKIEDERGPVMADKTLALLSKVFSWHASRSDEFRSPIVRGMRRSRPKDRARERILTDDEIRLVWHKASGTFGSLLRFILLTSARRSEAAQMTWGEIDGAVWTLPALRNKTKVDLVRPLSRMALDQLDGSKTKAQFVFPTRNGKPITDFWGYKSDFDKASGVSGYTIHDLRRTARSLLSRAGVNADVAERCLGHVIGGVRGIYDRHEYFEEKKRAFEALASQIERIVNPQANVVPMRGER